MYYSKSKNRYNIKNKKYYECISDIINHDKVIEMENYIQHGKTTVLEHSINVSYSSYLIAKILHLDYKSTARAGLLHDFYGYDWHTNNSKNKLLEKHGYTHPKIALENAKKYFNINELEEDIIFKHMWPLTITKIPKYKESFIVTIMDKLSASDETLKPKIKKIAQIVLMFFQI